MKDHAGGTDQDLIAIPELMGDLRQQAFPLHYDPIRGAEIFNDKRISAP
jgi:hypothetical protein